MNDEPDDNEQAEAEALARVLASDDPGDEVPEDALQAAALLRHAAPQGGLSPERAQAVLDGLLPKVGAARPASSRRWKWWLAGSVVPVAATAAALWLLLSTPGSGPSPSAETSVALAPVSAALAPPVATEGTPLPAPPAALLAAQAGLARGATASDRARFDAQMRGYREQMLQALERRYPAQLGMLETRRRR